MINEDYQNLSMQVSVRPLEIQKEIQRSDYIFSPCKPYAVGQKHRHFWLVDNYRNAYNLFACTGILVLITGPFLRRNRFVTQKIIFNQ